MRQHMKRSLVSALVTVVFTVSGATIAGSDAQPGAAPDTDVDTHAQRAVAEGRQTFRFDTFGDEAFWGDTIKLHQAIEGTRFGGVGPGVSPKMALTLGLKIDAAVLPADVVSSVKAGSVNLDDPAVTLMLLKLNSVVGVTGFFNANGS